MQLTLRCFLLAIMLIAALDGPSAAQNYSIALVGEIIIGQGLEPVMDDHGPRALFEGLHGMLQEHGVVVGTLGCSIGQAGERRDGVEHAFRAPAALARGLAYAGIRHVSLAAPHTMDYGPEGLEETWRMLDWYGVTAFGAGRNLTQARKLIVQQVPADQADASDKVGFLAYYHGGQFADAYADDSSPGLVGATWSAMERDVPDAASETSVLIVFIHWGIATDEAVSARQQLFAHRLIELGADIVVGQKSHVWQGMEIYQGKPIFYSLSDLFFDNYSRQHSRTIVPELHYEEGRLTRLRLVPIWLEPEEIPYQPMALKGDEAKKVLDQYQQLSPTVSLQYAESGDHADVEGL